MGRQVNDPAYPLTWRGTVRPTGREGWACRRVPHTDPRRYRCAPGTEHVEFVDGQRFVVDTRHLARAA